MQKYCFEQQFLYFHVLFWWAMINKIWNMQQPDLWSHLVFLPFHISLQNQIHIIRQNKYCICVHIVYFFQRPKLMRGSLLGFVKRNYLKCLALSVFVQRNYLKFPALLGFVQRNCLKWLALSVFVQRNYLKFLPLSGFVQIETY